MHKSQSRCHNLPLRTWIGGVNLLGYYGTDGKKMKSNTTLQDDEEEEEEEKEEMRRKRRRSTIPVIP